MVQSPRDWRPFISTQHMGPTSFFLFLLSLSSGPLHPAAAAKRLSPATVPSTSLLWLWRFSYSGAAPPRGLQACPELPRRGPWPHGALSAWTVAAARCSLAAGRGHHPELPSRALGSQVAASSSPPTMAADPRSSSPGRPVATAIVDLLDDPAHVVALTLQLLHRLATLPMSSRST